MQYSEKNHKEAMKIVDKLEKDLGIEEQEYKETKWNEEAKTEKNKDKKTKEAH